MECIFALSRTAGEGLARRWGFVDSGIGVAMNKGKYRGSNFDDFLKEEGILEEVEIRAAKRAIVVQLERLMKSQSLTKKAMAQRMRTSRASLDRLLDRSNTSVTLRTLGKAAQVVGRKLRIELLPV